MHRWLAWSLVLFMLLGLCPGCQGAAGPSPGPAPAPREDLRDRVQRAKQLYREARSRGEDTSEVDPLVSDIRRVQRSGDQARMEELVDQILGLLEGGEEEAEVAGEALEGDAGPAGAVDASLTVPEPAEGAGAGVVGRRFGLRGGRHSIPKVAPEVGAKWSRMILPWSLIQPRRGEFRWSDYDDQVRAFQKKGVNLLIVFQAMSEWAGSSSQVSSARGAKSGHKRSWMPPDTSLWTEFVRRVAERYDADGVDDMPGLVMPIDLFQGEVEYPRSWSGTAEEYVRYLRLTRATLRDANPTAQLATAGLLSEQVTGFAVCDDRLSDEHLWVRGRRMSKAEACRHRQLRSLRAQVDELFRSGEGAFDAVDLHLYGSYATIPDRMNWVWSQMERHGYHRPIWILEGGGPYTSVGEDYSQKKEAGYLWKWMGVALGAGADLVTWRVDVASESWGQQFRNLGLMDKGGGRKPAHTAYRLLTERLGGFETVVDLGLDGAWGYRFGNGDRTVHLLWSERGTVVKIPWGRAEAVIVRPDGGTSKERAEDGSLSLKLTSEPVLVE